MSSTWSATGWRPLGATVTLVLAGGLCALAACHPGSIDSVSELDTVVTTPNPDTDFGALTKTYAMPDTVLDLYALAEPPEEGQERPDTCTSNHDFDEQILAGIAENFGKAGWIRLKPELQGDNIIWRQPDGTVSPDPPANLVMVGASCTKGWVVSTWWPWWPGGGWYPGWGCCWSPWYPWWGTTATSFESGTLRWQLSDFPSLDKAQDIGDRESVHWQGLVNGILSGSTSSISSRLSLAIDQAFTQSPYLKGE